MTAFTGKSTRGAPAATPIGLSLDTGPRRMADLDDQLVPLINIVFLMLIFFMVAGEIQRGSRSPVDPPRSVSEATASEGPALLEVAVDGSLRLEAVPVAPEALVAQLARLPDPERRLRIRADAALPVGELQRILAQVRQAGILKSWLVTRQQGAPRG